MPKYVVNILLHDEEGSGPVPGHILLEIHELLEEMLMDYGLYAVYHGYDPNDDGGITVSEERIKERETGMPEQQWEPEDYGLCYVDHSIMYFCTLPPDQVWGDDWDDAPYEHNAGIPYRWDPSNQGTQYDIKVFRFQWRSGQLMEPRNIRWRNSPFTVQDINKGVIPWFQTGLESELGVNERTRIWAGDPMPEVVSTLRKFGALVEEIE